MSPERGDPMWRMAVLCVGVCLSLPASAATLNAVQGQILINHGNGFQRVANGAVAREGDLIMANPGSSAQVDLSWWMRHADQAWQPSSQ